MEGQLREGVMEAQGYGWAAGRDDGAEARLVFGIEHIGITVDGVGGIEGDGLVTDNV